MTDVILEGIVGSHAYGLAHANSDIDYRGVFVNATRDVLSLGRPKETIETKEPDRVLHEVEKFLNLALASNPNIIELLWIDQFTTITPAGRGLVDNRMKFVSQRAIHTYGGYAISQMKKMERLQRVDRKHARHCLRLLRQGREYITQGHLSVRVADPEEYWTLEALPFEDLLARLKKELDLFDTVKPSVPEEPDVAWANEYLLWIREQKWIRSYEEMEVLRHVHRRDVR